MHKLIDYFLHRRFLVNVLCLLVFVFSVVAFFTLKRDLHPPFEFKGISISTSLPGASSSEVEELVVKPMEDTLKGLPGVRSMDSTSENGRARIQLVFYADFEDMNEVVEQVRSQIDRIRYLLPQDLKPISIQRDKTTEIYLNEYAVVGIEETNKEHRQVFSRMIRELENVPGVISVYGNIATRMLRIQIYPERLEKMSLGVDQIHSAVRNYFSFAPLGTISENNQELQIELSRGQFDLKELGNLPIQVSRSGRSVQLKEVAHITYDLPKKNSLGMYRGQPAQFLTVFKAVDADSIVTSTAVEARMAEIQKWLPSTIQVDRTFDGKFFIEQQLNNLYMNGLFGFILVLVVLMIFLDKRTAVMTAIGMPLSYGGTLIVMSLMGVSIDLISLIGMILVIGILVDDAIIVSEKYVHKLGEGVSPFKAAQEAAHELLVPITGTIFTTVMAFLPIMLIKSEIATVLMAVPVVVMVSLIVSWLESFLILPNHLADFVTEVPKNSMTRFWERARDIYQSILRFTLRFRYLALVGTFGFLGFSLYFAANHLDQNFDLDIGLEQIRIFVTAKDSEAVETTAKKMESIHKYLDQLPEDKVQSYFTRIGSFWRDGIEKKGPQYARVTLLINKDAKYPKETRKEIRELLEKEMPQFLDPDFSEILVEERKRGREEEKKFLASLSISGGDSKSINEAKAEALKLLESKGPLGKWRNDELEQVPSWQFQADPKELARYGITYSSLGMQLRHFVERHEIAILRDGFEDVYVMAEYGDPDQIKTSNLKNLSILSSEDLLVPIKYLGNWSQSIADQEIHRKNRERRVKLDFSYDEKNSNVVEAKNFIEKTIEPLKNQFKNLHISATDANEWETENRNWSQKVLIYCLLLILTVLILTLKSFVQPLIVFISITFSLAGIIWAFYFHGFALSLMGMIGIVGCAGVAVNDSIVMINEVNLMYEKARRKGRDLIIGGASSRLRAIFLTWLTTLAGLAPSAYGIGGDAGFTQPLALAMGWGLFTATLLNLLLTPTFLAIREDIMNLWGRMRNKGSRSTPPLELALSQERMSEPFL